LQAFFESGIESSLLIVGEGDVQEVDRVKGIVYEYGLQEKVFFVGFLKNPYPIIKNAKALILTSEREGLPTVLIESLMLNTPVASFDCPSGPSEILTPYLRDWLVDLKDTSALASKIKELDSGSHLIPSQSIDIYSPSAVAEKFESLAY
jgi:glycosyltransferase involved in cell wall biosynthesis